MSAKLSSPTKDSCRFHRILVVDDHPDVLESLTTLLTLWGQEVRGAPSGASALEVAREFRPNVAFIDLGLPDIDGSEVCRRLRAEYGKSLRLYALTGFTQAKYRALALESGFDLYVQKPIEALLLRQLLSIPDSEIENEPSAH
jgi:DNA-binding response OmpR family regulator